LEALLGFVRDGDTLIMHSMDRLARNLDDLRAIVRVLTARGVRVEFVKGTAHLHRRRLPDGQPAAFGHGRVRRVRTRAIHERQREGITLAKQRGAYRGRKKSLTTDQIDQLAQRAAAGEPKSALAREFNISRETVYQYIRATTAAAATT